MNGSEDTTRSGGGKEEHTPAEPIGFQWNDPPKWAAADLWKPRYMLRGRVWGSDYTPRARQWEALRVSDPARFAELEHLDELPSVYSFRQEDFRTSWPAGTPREETDRELAERLNAKASGDHLAYRGIHEHDWVSVCTAWRAFDGEVVLAQTSEPTQAGGTEPVFMLGVYRVNETGEWLEADGPPPYYRGKLLAHGPFPKVWPVAQVAHCSVDTRDDHGRMCLDRYPPEVFQPWWKADDDDRRRYPVRPVREEPEPEAGIAWMSPSILEERPGLLRWFEPDGRRRVGVQA